MIANVDGVMNAVLVKGDAVGNTLYYGAGAGAEPTASAVVADILDIVRTLDVPAACRVPHLGFQPESIQTRPVKTSDQFECAYYLRFDVNDVAGVMTKLSAEFAGQNISIEAITQKEPKVSQDFVSVIFITQRTTERQVDQAISNIASLDNVRTDAVKIRVEHFN